MYLYFLMLFIHDLENRDLKILFTVIYSKLSERNVYTEKLKQTETILIKLIKIQVAPQTLRSRARPTLLVPTAIAVWNW